MLVHQGCAELRTIDRAANGLHLSHSDPREGSGTGVCRVRAGAPGIDGFARGQSEATHLGLYFFSSSLAIKARCTSSGPSAMRSVRIVANISAIGKSAETPAPPCI